MLSRIASFILNTRSELSTSQFSLQAKQSYYCICCSLSELYINAESNSFITSTGSKYGYNFLAKATKGVKRQRFYNDVYQMCVKFWNQTIDRTTQTYSSRENNILLLLRLLTDSMIFQSRKQFQLIL